MQKLVPKITTKPFELFLDLDGVFADFDGRVKHLTGLLPHQLHKSKMWAAIHRDDAFFYRLELMKDAHHLWEYAKQYNPTFLTGLPTKRGGKEEKVRWVMEKFGEYPTIVLPKREKQNHSGPNKLLVDDTDPNIQQWVAKGGLAVHHKDVWTTIAEIEALRLGYQV